MLFSHGLVLSYLSVVVDDLYIPSATILPAKAKTPLVIDSNAVLSFAATFERLQAIARWYAQMVKQACPMQV